MWILFCFILCFPPAWPSESILCIYLISIKDKYWICFSASVFVCALDKPVSPTCTSQCVLFGHKPDCRLCECTWHCCEQANMGVVMQHKFEKYELLFCVCCEPGLIMALTVLSADKTIKSICTRQKKRVFVVDKHMTQIKRECSLSSLLFCFWLWSDCRSCK